jgi:hypothetical protein
VSRDLGVDMNVLDDREVMSLVDQGLAWLRARLSDEDHVEAEYPGLGEDEAESLGEQLEQACDRWDEFADAIPGFRDKQ